MYLLNYAQCLACAALISIIALTLAALVSRQVRAYAQRHPWRYAALAVLLSVSAVRAAKPPIPGPTWTGLYLNLLKQEQNDETYMLLRPVDFEIQAK